MSIEKLGSPVKIQKGAVLYLQKVRKTNCKTMIIYAYFVGLKGFDFCAKNSIREIS